MEPVFEGEGLRLFQGFAGDGGHMGHGSVNAYIIDQIFNRVGRGAIQRGAHLGDTIRG